MNNPFLKKILFVLILGVLMTGSFTYGIMSVRRQNWAYGIYVSLYQQKQKLFSEDSQQDGIWHDAPTQSGATGLSAEQKKAISNLSSLAYLKGYNEAPDIENVSIYDADAAYDGYNYILSANAPNAFITDMLGNVLHEWRKDFNEVWSPSYTLEVPEVYKSYWRRALLLENGDLIAMFMNYGLIRLDARSNLLWEYKGRVHHDLFEAPNGDIYVLSRQIKKHDGLKLESWHSGDIVLEDFITILSSDGKEIRNFSLVDCFLNSEYASHLEHIKVPFDILHANTIRRIDDSHPEHPIFIPGHILVSMREIHTIAVIDPEAEKVTWAATGLWKYQHEPRILKNGNILLFDNRGNHGKSKAIEFEPITKEVKWAYRGEPEKPFYSREAGTLERLPNGNTLVTESETGRAFEVTRDGRIVWEFYNPNRAGENNELIAALYDVIRIKPDDLKWLEIGTQ